MKLHEHQAKSIFADAGIPVPESRLASTVDEALAAVDEIGYPAAIKAQVHVGGRGKAGGIEIATDREEAADYAEAILGMDLKGYTVEEVLVESGVDFVDELYVGVTMDRGAGEPVLMVSTEGGVDIEEVAETTPERSHANTSTPPSVSTRIRPGRSSTRRASTATSPSRSRRSSRRCTSCTRRTTRPRSRSTR